jgi:hypothetical protein
MKTIEHYTERPEVGLPVFWYPRGRKDPSTTPRVGFVAFGHTRGVCDISVLPNQDGAVEYVENVFHMGDPRVQSASNPTLLSRAAEERGCWEFTPMALAHLEAKTSPKKAKA